MQIRSYVTGYRKRLASLGFMASEGGSGNDLERLAAQSLEANANSEAHGAQLVEAAVKNAKYEVSNLYEDALRASGKKTRVIAVANFEPF